MAKEIPGLKLIRHNANGVNIPDDPSFPFKLEVLCRPPEFMAMAFIAMHGNNEELVVRSKTRAALDKFIELNDLRGPSTPPASNHYRPKGLDRTVPEKISLPNPRSNRYRGLFLFAK